METTSKKRPLEHAPIPFSKKPKIPPANPPTASECFDAEEVLPGIWSPDNDGEANESSLELAKLLESTANDGSSSAPFRVRFVSQYPNYSALPSAVLFESSTSSSYVTINGNEETCGSSFSDSDSSVMASIDLAGLNVSGAANLLALWSIGCVVGGDDGGYGGAWGSMALGGDSGGESVFSDWDDVDEALARFIAGEGDMHVNL